LLIALIETEATELKAAVLGNLAENGEALVARGLERFWEEPNIEKIAEILAITHEDRAPCAFLF